MTPSIYSHFCSFIILSLSDIVRYIEFCGGPCTRGASIIANYVFEGVEVVDRGFLICDGLCNSR